MFDNNRRLTARIINKIIKTVERGIQIAGTAIHPRPKLEPEQFVQSNYTLNT